jgi:predicted metal-dependent enzyme (double-stranded beta helix superfamily)
MTRPTGTPIIGTDVLFENERVKIWDFVLGPGEAMPMHTHRLDHVIIVIEGGELEVTYADGTERAFQPKPGDNYFCHVEGEETHDARNVGPTRYRNLIIELKDR